MASGTTATGIGVRTNGVDPRGGGRYVAGLAVEGNVLITATAFGEAPAFPGVNVPVPLSVVVPIWNLPSTVRLFDAVGGNVLAEFTSSR